jgi:hypothetical protein
MPVRSDVPGYTYLVDGPGWPMCWCYDFMTAFVAGLRWTGETYRRSFLLIQRCVRQGDMRNLTYQPHPRRILEMYYVLAFSQG